MTRAAFFLLLTLTAAACTEPPTIDPNLGPVMEPDTTTDMASCQTQTMVCDAIYIPRVDFELSTPDGLYCGDATISYQADGQTITKMCTCGSMPPAADMGPGPTSTEPGLKGCVIDPPVGETTSVTVEAPGYAPLMVDVTLPCECHPKATVTETLAPM